MSVKKEGDFDMGIFSDIQREKGQPKTKIDLEKLTKNTEINVRDIMPIYDRLYK
jgi:hypothetical protein